MAFKKIYFIIVEGPSDETALGFAFNEYLNPNEVHIEILHCDITSDYNITPANIIKRINDKIKNYQNRYHIKKDDIIKIVHIVDIDGAFLRSEKIISDNTVEKVMYYENYILTKDVNKIIERNKSKKANLLKLSGTKQISSIPYYVYFMSCNLDHVLYNKLNSDDADKEHNAHSFAKNYKNALKKFILFLATPSISREWVNYESSWTTIIDEKEKILRLTNLNLFFK